MTLAYDEPLPYDEPESYDGPSIIANCFFTPQVLVNPPYLPSTRGPALGLFRHYASNAMGVNVFLLSNLTFVQDYPTTISGGMTYRNPNAYRNPNFYSGTTPGQADNSDTNIPYPWDSSKLPPPPFSRVYDIFGNETDTSVDPYIVKMYPGGHFNPVTPSELYLLYEAGYSGCLIEHTFDAFPSTFLFGETELYCP